MTLRPFYWTFFRASLIVMRFVRLFFSLFVALFTFSACGSYYNLTSMTTQSVEIAVTGADKGFCKISSPDYHYNMHIPGIIKIERDSEPLKFDCYAPDGKRRRIMTVSPVSGVLSRYPELITIDFDDLQNATRYNGFRGVSPTGQSTVLTEDSFAYPIETSQAYPVPRTHAIIGRRSHPVPLH